MNVRIVVLAAGKGKRMQSDLPKVLCDLKGKPIIKYLAESIINTGIDSKPTIIVGRDNKILIEATLGEQFAYVVQDEQLGTGHAVSCAEPSLNGLTDAVIVLYGDHPLVSSKTILRLRELHEANDSVITMMTVKVPNFDEWRRPLYDFGRVVRGVNGKIQGIVEKKDATLGEIAIQEVSPSFFCFQAEWLWNNLPKLKNQNAQKEYYLTDLVRIAIDQGKEVASMDIDPLESIGVNTPEHLELAREVL